MLHRLSPSKGSRKRRKRVGRGISAGGGKTAGRGTKGQHARTGKGRRLGFEGGQVPLLRRQPKLGGFRSPKRVVYSILHVHTVEEKLQAGSYTLEQLRERGLVHKIRPVKLLCPGVLTKKVTIVVHATSKGARAAVEKAGG